LGGAGSCSVSSCKITARPGLNIVGTQHGYLDSTETENCAKLSQTSAAVNFVGLGVPRQEFGLLKTVSLSQATWIGVGGSLIFGLVLSQSTKLASS